MARRLAAIVFTDIAGYTALSQRDESAALRLLRDQERLVRGLLEVHQGHWVKSIGDGLLIEFANARDAVEFAVDLQRHIQDRNAREVSTELRVRIGIHLGDVEGTGADILGDAVNIASRIEALADPGGVCLTESVFLQVRNKVAYPLEEIGPKALKGVSTSVRVYRVGLPSSGGVSTGEQPRPPRVAVLPFENISPDTSDAYFADGLTEELTSVLSQIGGLRVVARTSVGQYRSTSKSVAQIGSELGVASVLEGSVRKVGDRLRITVQLIDTQTQDHRWAQTYDRRLEDVFAIQADVAEQTARALKVQLLRSESDANRKRPTSSLNAYEYYLRGVEASCRWDVEFTRRPFLDREAVRCLEAAIAEDPGYSEAYSFLANHLIGVMGISRPRSEVLPRVRELVQQALRLNQNSSDAHLAAGNLALQADFDWAAAEREFRQAIALNPSNSLAHYWYAYLHSMFLRFDLAREEYRTVVDLDPLWDLPQIALALLPIQAAGNLTGAISDLERLERHAPDSQWARSILANLYALVGRSDEARRLVAPLTGATDLGSRRARATTLALLGATAELRSLLDDWEQGRITEYFPLARVAQGFSLLGQQEKALELLQRDSREGDRTLWMDHQSYIYDPIRDDPRFAEMVRAMSLPSELARTWRLSLPITGRSPTKGE